MLSSGMVSIWLDATAGAAPTASSRRATRTPMVLPLAPRSPHGTWACLSVRRAFPPDCGRSGRTGRRGRPGEFVSHSGGAGGLPAGLEGECGSEGSFVTGAARAVGGSSRLRRLELFFRNSELLIHARVGPQSQHPLRDVVADLGPELEAFGVSAAGDPHVRHLRMAIDDEIAAGRDLVVTGVRLRDRGVRSEERSVGEEGRSRWAPDH